MGRDGSLNREWVEIVLVLEDCTLIDSAYDLHILNGRQHLAKGFYLAAHRGKVRDFSKAELVGPFAQRGISEMLYESALHMGAAARPDTPASAGVSVLAMIRRQAEDHLATRA